MCINVWDFSIQLSIYTALQPNAEGGHTLIHKEDQFDVNSKFERFGLLYYDSKLKWRHPFYFKFTFLHNLDTKFW